MCENNKYIVRISGQLVFVKKEACSAYYGISRRETYLYKLSGCRARKAPRHIGEAQCPQCPQCRIRSPPNSNQVFRFFHSKRLIGGQPYA